MWAVRQSPFTVPDKLSEALTGLSERLSSIVGLFDDAGMAQMSGVYLEEILLRHFADVPEILAWNRPKSGHDAPFVMTSRYGGPSPDDHIIDLHALARNVNHTLILARLYEKEGA